MTRNYLRDSHAEGGRSLRRDVLICGGGALFIATAFSAWVLALYLRGGTAPFDAVGTTPGAVLLLYYCAAILVGPLVGILLPLARATRWGAALVGMVAALPLYAMARITLEGFAPWTAVDTVSVIAMSIMVGPLVGLAYRHIFSDL